VKAGTACDEALHAPVLPHRARRYIVLVLVLFIVAAKPKLVLVPVEDVCQYQFTPVGGFVVLAISVDEQFLI
jgi:hypothetical protein